MNGRRLTMTSDEAYDLVMAVPTGNVEDVAQIARLLAAGSGQREHLPILRARHDAEAQSIRE